MSRKPKRPVLPTDVTGEVSLVYPFSEKEYRKGIAVVKNGKAAGLDDVMVKQQHYLGPTLHNYLLDMHNKCFTENNVPRL